ncbi:MAG: hypothetical protein NTW38_01000 [Candidatus Aminicenantes bacterium]|nr:hypothetical protein [Candidatus Aminicenantes bacterium]
MSLVRISALRFRPKRANVWPPDNQAHDPMNWVLEYGRFDAARWGKTWQDLFDTQCLVHNRRVIRKIEISREGDGAFAVVDIDTLWRDAEGRDQLGKGRVCKVYALLGAEWKMTMHTGILEYS